MYTFSGSELVRGRNLLSRSSFLFVRMDLFYKLKQSSLNLSSPIDHTLSAFMSLVHASNPCTHQGYVLLQVSSLVGEELSVSSSADLPLSLVSP